MEAYTSTTRRAPVLPHIERVVGREMDGDRFLEPALRDRLFVHRQRARAAFAGAAAVVGEVEADRAAARGQRIRGGDRVFLETEPAVEEGRFAVEY